MSSTEPINCPIIVTPPSLHEDGAPGGGNTNLPTSLKRDIAWDMPSGLQRSTAWTMPSGDTIEDAEDVEAIVLANAGCRLPTSQPALDDYDQAMVDAQLITDDSELNAIFPEYGPLTDGNPGIPTLDAPAHQATGVPTTVTLTWAASDETDCYQIRFGTTDDPPPLIPGCITETEWQPPTLQSNTTYYWQIIATDSCNHLSLSPVRSFTTGS